jgi:3',5'-cyclic AMP phosphodiesterase CpdA
MMRRISVLIAAAALAASAQTVEFIQITDTHVMRIEGIHPVLVPQRQANLASASQLEGWLESLRQTPPAFIIHTGDMLEAFRYDDAGGRAVEGQIERFLAIGKRSPAPMYLALGNRDVSWYRAADGRQVVVRDSTVTSEARAAWRRQAECFSGGTWYSFEKRAGAATYLFAVLDNSETSDRSIVDRQLTWFRKTISEAKASAVVVAAHIPLEENAFGAAVKEILSGFDKPVLILAGHRHTDAVEELSSAPRRVQVRTASFTGGKSSSRRIVLTSNGIDVHATNEPDRLLLRVPVPPVEP